MKSSSPWIVVLALGTIALSRAPITAQEKSGDKEAVEIGIEAYV